MAKKVRRVRRRSTPGGEAAANNPPLSKEEEFRQEYAYVLKDLRLVFIIAGVMFLLLFTLNFLLR